MAEDTIYNPCSGQNCLGTIILPCCVGDTGATGATGDPGASIIYHNHASSTKTGAVGGWQVVKTYTLGTTQLSTNGDALLVDTWFSVQVNLATSCRTELHINGSPFVAYDHYPQDAAEIYTSYVHMTGMLRRTDTAAASPNMYFSGDAYSYATPSTAGQLQLGYALTTHPQSVTVPYASSVDIQLWTQFYGSPHATNDTMTATIFDITYLKRTS